MKTLTKYIDMDGVLADFNKEPNAVERFRTEKGFFANLEPIRQNVNAVKYMIRKGEIVKVLSASPNEQADKDKLLWLQEFIPELQKENIIICRNGDNKADFVEDIENSILYDDYSKNIREFRNAGGQAIQIKTKSQLLEIAIN